MTLARLSLLLLFFSPCPFAQGISTQFQLSSESALLQFAVTPPAGAMIVYVSDFDLDVVYRKPQPRPAPPTSPRPSARPASENPSASLSTSSAGTRKTTWTAPAVPVTRASQPPSTPEDSREETPADRANALVNQVSETLIRALTEAGYDARRLTAGSPLPKEGLRLRGVFAEADERNRARRLLVGGEPVGAKVILFVGVNNLSQPEQPLYLLADPPAPDPRHGPVITVTSYAPAARFELSREPSDDELKKISANIAASLTALVNANRMSLAQ